MLENLKNAIIKKGLTKGLKELNSIEEIDTLMDLAKKAKNTGKISIDFYNIFILDATEKKIKIKKEEKES